MKKCHYCKSDAYAEHHINYKTDEKVPVCLSCHGKIKEIMSGSRNSNRYLCINCGRHFTSNSDKLCWYCHNPTKKDWFGLTAKDRTKPIYRYNYHWIKTNWL